MASLVQALDQDMLGAWRCLLLPCADQQVEASAIAATQTIVADHFDCVLGKWLFVAGTCWHNGRTAGYALDKMAPVCCVRCSCLLRQASCFIAKTTFLSVGCAALTVPKPHSCVDLGMAVSYVSKVCMCCAFCLSTACVPTCPL